QRYAFLFVVSFAQIAADKGVVGVQAGGNFEVPASLIQTALADLCEAQAEPREGISLIKRDRFVKGLLGLLRLDLRQVGETQHRLCAREIRLQGDRLLGRVQGLI